MPETAYTFFNLAPAPNLDLAALKELFLKISAESHPDKFQSYDPKKAEAEKKFAEVNRAYQILSDPKERLLHLYEIEAGSRPKDVQRIPPGTMNLFIEIGKFCQKVDAFFEKKSKAESALEKANLMGESLELQEELIALDRKLETLKQQLDQDLIALDHDWRLGKKELNSLENLYRRYSYLSRWRQQLEERRLSLLEI